MIAGVVTITVTDTGAAVLTCSGCGELRREDRPALVAGNVGALAKSHASLHATAAAQGLSFAYVAALLDRRRPFRG